MALPVVNGNVVQAIAWKDSGGVPQNLSLATGSDAHSTKMPANTTVVRLVATVDAWVRVSGGASDTANNFTYLPANVVEYVEVAPNSSYIHARGVSTTGTLNITECS